jgi:hypothetical protein
MSNTNISLDKLLSKVTVEELIEFLLEKKNEAKPKESVKSILTETIKMDREATRKANFSTNKVDFVTNDVLETNVTPIYIYNISNIEFFISRPPNFPRVLIRKCPLDQEYIQVGSLTHPFIEMYDDVHLNGEKTLRSVDGFREASRLLNPHSFSNLPEHQWNDQFEDIYSNHQGQNLNNYGVFWSLNQLPTREELDKAKLKLLETYAKELQKMFLIEKESESQAQQYANNISHAAASYFSINTSWHQTLVKK